MARKTREDALRTRAAILDAAETVFYEQGFGRTSLEDVASAASVTRGAIYWHFKNKMDLFTAMVDRVRLPIETLAEGTSGECQNPLGQLRDIGVLMLRETATNPRRQRVLTIVFHRCELTTDLSELEARQRAAYVDCMGRVERCLAQAVQAGQLPAGLAVKRAAFAWHAFLVGLISNWLFFPQAFDLEAEAEGLVDAALAMLKVEVVAKRDAA